MSSTLIWLSKVNKIEIEVAVILKRKIHTSFFFLLLVI